MCKQLEATQWSCDRVKVPSGPKNSKDMIWQNSDLVGVYRRTVMVHSDVERIMTSVIFDFDLSTIRFDLVGEYASDMKVPAYVRIRARQSLSGERRDVLQLKPTVTCFRVLRKAR